MYASYRLTITPLSAFATPLMGDTLFGQLCWTLREELGESALNKLLAAYQEQPFAVISDAMPAGFLPRPHLPPQYLGLTNDATQRKQWKKIHWIPLELLNQPVAAWLECASAVQPAQLLEQAHPHNSINRLTGTTGREGFAPYAVEEYWHKPDTRLHVYALIDESCISADLLQTLFERMGAFGFGKDASTGLGKFRVDTSENILQPLQLNANAWLTLAPCAPQGLGYDGSLSYWEPFTRYGRHGNFAVLNNPFKNPVLMAATGSVFRGDELKSPLFVGQGLGGNGAISNTIPETVHQGYAAVIGICLPETTQGKIA